MTVGFNACTGVADYIGLDVIGVGYIGVLTMTSPDGATLCTIQLEQPVEVRRTSGLSTAATLDWVAAYDGNPSSVEIFDDLYRAALATYFPNVPPEPAGTTCNQTGACTIGLITGQYAYF